MCTGCIGTTKSNIYVNNYNLVSYLQLHNFNVTQNQTKDFASWKSIKIEENTITDRCENYPRVITFSYGVERKTYDLRSFSSNLILYSLIIVLWLTYVG